MVGQRCEVASAGCPYRDIARLESDRVGRVNPATFGGQELVVDRLALEGMPKRVLRHTRIG